MKVAFLSLWILLATAPASADARGHSQRRRRPEPRHRQPVQSGAGPVDRLGNSGGVGCRRGAPRRQASRARAAEGMNPGHHLE